MAIEAPATRPANPRFSSGPCAKIPTFELSKLSDAALGRSHRAAIGKEKLKAAIEETRDLLGIPADYKIGIFNKTPITNYMGHAIVCMVALLRGTADKGLAYGNGGIVTTNHAILLSGAPLDGVRFPQDYDVQDRADAARGPVPALDERYAGPVTVESWTV